MVVSHMMLKHKATTIQFQNVFYNVGLISSEQENNCLHNNRGKHRCGLGYTNCREEVLYFKRRKLKGGKLLLVSLCFLKYIVIHFDGCIFSLALLACYLGYKSILTAPCEYSSPHCLLHLLIPMFDESISWLQRIKDSEIPTVIIDESFSSHCNWLWRQWKPSHHCLLHLLINNTNV